MPYTHLVYDLHTPRVFPQTNLVYYPDTPCISQQTHSDIRTCNCSAGQTLTITAIHYMLQLFAVQFVNAKMKFSPEAASLDLSVNHLAANSQVDNQI
jgi:hypothetical protein